jgi:hypothetical protein
LNKDNLLKITLIFLVVYLLLDTGYTFYQHSTKALDGDLVAIVLPAERYQAVMNDPFGFQVLLEDKTYAAPNRFFVHWYISNYFMTVPKLFQRVVSPAESLYYASGLSKTAIHVLLITLLAFMVSGARRLWTKEWIIAAVIIAPMFQTGGHFYKYIGVVDQSITYSSFYALPLCLLLLFLIPFQSRFMDKEVKLTIGSKIGLFLLTLILPFSGPLVPGVVLVIAFLWAIYTLVAFVKTSDFKIFNKLPKTLVLYFVWITLLSLYSIYIGRNNAENFNWTALPILERYQRLPIGLYYQLTEKLAFPLLLLMIFINTYLIRRFDIQKAQMLKLLKWIGLFSLIYLLLLPLGGSREYRPNILRKDTMLPIILALIYYYGQTTFLIIRYTDFKYWKGYLVVVMLFALIFTYADEPDADQHLCERRYLGEISKSPDSIVKLTNDCTILSWDIIKDPKGSADHAQLFKLWNITTADKLFYQE